MNASVIELAWLHSDPTPTDLPQMGGICGRCGKHRPGTVPTSAVLSRSFSSYDGWRARHTNRLCSACAWAYTHPPLRQIPHQVTTAGTFTPLTGGQLWQALQRPLPASTALVVPLRPNRRHLIAEAIWGCVTTDAGPLPWSTPHCDLLGLIARLDEFGVSPHQVSRSTAPPATLVKAALHHPEALCLWEAIEPWRVHRHPWLALAAHARHQANTAPLAGAA